MNPDRLVKAVFYSLAALFVLFIVYASWTPGEGGLGTPPGHFRGFQQVDESFRVHDLRDIATNVLLYIPLGVFLALARVRGGRRGEGGGAPRGVRFLTPWILAGTAVSLTMEVGQSFIGRTPDVVDLVTNSAGYAIGFWLVAAAVRYYGLDPVVFLGLDPDEVGDTKVQSIAAFRFMYICVYVLIALLPFDVSVSLSKVYAQLLPDDLGRTRLILDPAYTLSRWQDTGLKLTLEWVGLVPVGALTAFLDGVRGRPSVFRAVLTCVWVALACETAQVFILSRTTDVVMIPVAVVAGAAGWALVRVWFGLQEAEAPAGGVRDEGNWRPLAVALVGYALVVAFLAWSPFRFETDPVTVARKVLHESNVVPFREHFATRDLGSAIDIVKETGLFVPFGLLLALLLTQIRPGLPRTRVIVVTGVLSAAFATLTELSQAVCVDRYIDATDVLLAGVGGACGAVLLRLFRLARPGAG